MRRDILAGFICRGYRSKGHLVGKYVAIEAVCVFLTIASRSPVRENVTAYSTKCESHGERRRVS